MLGWATWVPLRSEQLRIFLFAGSCPDVGCISCSAINLF
jgi:hypothetical protein